MVTLTSAKQSAIIDTHNKLLINNEWVDSVSGNKFVTINPATEEVICEVAEANANDLDLAVEAARKAFALGEWSRMSGGDRAALLYKLADLLEELQDELAHLETLDNGKPLQESLNIDLPLTIQCYRYFAGWADKIQGKTIPVAGDYLSTHCGFNELGEFV